MADRPVSPVNKEESATTREEMTFSDNEQETGRVSPLGHETANKPPKKTPSPRPRVSFQDQDDEIPPQKPPRPMSPQQQSENTLIEAFPLIDTKVVKAVLAASGGKVEPAFNALLGMSDPSYKPEEAPPARPPRPAQQQRQPQNQLEADEQYARRLAEQYNNQGSRQPNQYNQRESGRRGPNQQPQQYNEEERSFFDDELPEIGRNIQRGFFETQKQVNSWITTFKKRIDGEDDEEDLYSGSSSRPQGRQNFGSSQSEQLHGIRKSSENQRRSHDQQRYDADPHELGDEEFSRLELRDDEARESDAMLARTQEPAKNSTAPPQPPRTSSRKPTNPDLFKPQPKPPQSGPVDEVDAADRRVSAAGGDAEKNKKWQSLTSVAPHPEDDNDPFSLGDDDEGNDKAEDMRKEDSDRLKEAARNSVSVGESGKSGPTLQESEQSGSKNKEAEELLSGKKS